MPTSAHLQHRNLSVRYLRHDKALQDIINPVRGTSSAVGQSSPRSCGPPGFYVNMCPQKTVETRRGLPDPARNEIRQWNRDQNRTGMVCFRQDAGTVHLSARGATPLLYSELDYIINVIRRFAVTRRFILVEMKIDGSLCFETPPS